MTESAPDDTDETTSSHRIDPLNRLDEALKQIRIAKEKAEADVDTELQAAAEELRSARAALAAAD